MEQYQSTLRRRGSTLEKDKAGRMPERPRARMVEDWSSGFVTTSKDKGKAQANDKHSNVTRRKAGRSTRVFSYDDASSDDEIDFLSQSSRAGSSSPQRPSVHSQDKAKASDGIQIDGEFHRWHEAFPPSKTKLPSFKKNKPKDTPPEGSDRASSSNSTPATRTAKEKSPPPRRPPMLVDSATRPTHKVLGMRPIGPKDRFSATPGKLDAERTPKPVKRAHPRAVSPVLVQSSDSETEVVEVKPKTRTKGKEKAREEAKESEHTRPKAKARDFPMDVAEAKIKDKDADKPKARGFPMDVAKEKVQAKPKAQGFPMDLSTSIEDMAPPDSDSDSRTRTSRNSKGKETTKPKTTPQAFPMEIPPRAGRSNAAPKPGPKPFPLIAASSQDSVRSEPPARRTASQRSPSLSSVQVSKSSPPPYPSTRTSPRHRQAKAATATTTEAKPLEKRMDTTIQTRTGPARRRTGVKKGRVVSSSSNADSSEESDNSAADGTYQDEETKKKKKKQKLKPFPMHSQLLLDMDSPPSKGKRFSLDESMQLDREPKRMKDADEIMADFMATMEDEDSFLFLNPNVDPATLCPWCDEPLPPVPSPHLQKLIAAARTHSAPDGRPTNPLGLYAAPTVFINVCQRHRFESVQVPLAKKRGWPTQIDWAGLGRRVCAMRDALSAILKDVDEAFIPGRERGDDDDEEEDEDKDAVDDVELLKTRPRMGSAFWKEVVKGVKKKGSRQAAGVRGQMTSFSKTQPGYYGELGYVVINQTIYDLFPPADVDAAAVRPLTPTEFIQRVLVPEAAVRLVMADLGQTRARAIRTLRESASYGVAMFPDEQEGAPEGKSRKRSKGTGKGKERAEDAEVEMEMDAGERIVRERAAARRRQLEKEEREEAEAEAGEAALWAGFSEPPSGSELDAVLTGAATQTKSKTSMKSGTPTRPRRGCAGRTRTLEASSSGSDVEMKADDDYVPARSQRSSKTSRARAPHASDTEDADTHSHPQARPRPRPRPKPRPLDATSETGGAESMSEGTDTNSPKDRVGRWTRTLWEDVESDAEGGMSPEL
ncbi:hypothetical protein EIP86_008009 [Pleurotus ostreatoroseus]|nr:hypothetical protein EIP86_008009 [Pleurotus ostreatoroseus]